MMFFGLSAGACTQHAMLLLGEVQHWGVSLASGQAQLPVVRGRRNGHVACTTAGRMMVWFDLRCRQFMHGYMCDGTVATKGMEVPCQCVTLCLLLAVDAACSDGHSCTACCVVDEELCMMTPAGCTGTVPSAAAKQASGHQQASKQVAVQQPSGMKSGVHAWRRTPAVGVHRCAQCVQSGHRFCLMLLAVAGCTFKLCMYRAELFTQ